MMKKAKVIVVAGAVFLSMTAAAFFAAAQNKSPLPDAKDLFDKIQLFTDSISLISSEYVEPVQIKDLVYGAVRGMMSTLDGYSQFLEPEGFREITEETKGEFGGVGIEVGLREGVLTVIAPIDDTPACKAGIQSGDIIVKIDGKSTRDYSLDDAVKRMRGAPGTKVKLVVIREGVEKMMEFELTRATVKVKSIKTAELIEGNIGYVKLAEFQQNTTKDMERTLGDLTSKGAKNIILDLRNNPGGLLDAAVGVSELFLEPGEMVVYTEGRDHRDRTEYRVKKKHPFEWKNVVVLINKGSASASEITAGAIRDNKKGIVVGTRSFGKGSVQAVIPLRDESALRITTAYYYSPSGKNINKKGVEPDITVEYYKADAQKEKPANGKAEKVFESVGEDEEGTADEQPDGGENEKKDGAKKENGDKERPAKAYDSQMAAAINIIKGIEVTGAYKNPDNGKTTVQKS
jgi:carboxyl-terminal processing protease